MLGTQAAVVVVVVVEFESFVGFAGFVDFVDAVVVDLVFVIFGPADAGLPVDFTFTGFTAAVFDFGAVDFTLAAEGFACVVTFGP